MSETLEEEIKRKTAKAYKIMEVPNTISQEELNIIYNNKKKYYGENATRIASLDVAYDLIKKDRGFVSSSSASAAASAASNAPAGSSAAASAASNAALKEEMEHVMRLLRGEAPPQSKKQEKKSNFYSAFNGEKQAQGTAKQENRQNQSSNKNKNKNKKEKDAFALFGTTEQKLRELSVEEAKKKINKEFKIQSLKYHPDRPNGNKNTFQKWSAAKDLIDIAMGWKTKNEERKGGTRKNRKN